MAQKYIIDQRRREERQRHYLAAPVLAQEFPRIKELIVHLRFVDPAGKVTPSPYNRIFAADMQAFFDFDCPLRDCTEGGFDLRTAISNALSKRGADHGKTRCKGKRKRTGETNDCCGLELQYEISIQQVEKGRRSAGG